MNDLRELVDQAVRKQLSAEEWERLLSPTLVEQTYAVLVAMKKNVESQLGAKRADHALQVLRTTDPARIAGLRGEWLNWRAGALRFKSGVEDLLLQVRTARLLNEGDTDRLRSERNHAIHRVVELEEAIRAHHSHSCDEKCDPVCQADEQLWQHIDVGQ